MLDIDKISKISEDLAFQDTTIVDLTDRLSKIEDFTKDIQENGSVTATHQAHPQKQELNDDSDDFAREGMPQALRRDGVKEFGPSLTNLLKVADRKTTIQLEHDKLRELKNQVKMVVQNQQPSSKADVIDRVMASIAKKKRWIDYLIKKSKQIDEARLAYDNHRHGDQKNKIEPL